MKQLFSVICVLLVAGCLHTPKPVSDHSERVTLRGFSLLPPNEEGWYEMDKQESSMTFGKKCKTGEFKTFASASLLDFDTQVKSEQEFLDTVKSLREIYINPDEKQIVAHTEQLAPKMGKYCVKYGLKTKSDTRMEEKFGMTCRHPKNHNFIVDSSVLQRYQEGEDAGNIMKTAAKFIPHVEFEALGAE